MSRPAPPTRTLRSSSCGHVPMRRNTNLGPHSRTPHPLTPQGAPLGGDERGSRGPWGDGVPRPRSRDRLSGLSFFFSMRRRGHTIDVDKPSRLPPRRFLPTLRLAISGATLTASPSHAAGDDTAGRARGRGGRVPGWGMRMLRTSAIRPGVAVPLGQGTKQERWAEDQAAPACPRATSDRGEFCVLDCRRELNYRDTLPRCADASRHS